MTSTRQPNVGHSDSSSSSKHAGRFYYVPYRDRRKQNKYVHKMFSGKDKGTNQNYVKFGNFRADEDDLNYQVGHTGTGLTLRPKYLNKRTPHHFRKESLALNRILTYLSENLLSYLASKKFPGLAEVQIGWISDLNCMLITENNVKEFYDNIEDLNSEDLIGYMTKKGDHQLKSQGSKEYYEKRMRRHNEKLSSLINKESRYDDLIKIDPEIKKLISFLEDP